MIPPSFVLSIQLQVCERHIHTSRPLLLVDVESQPIVTKPPDSASLDALERWSCKFSRQSSLQLMHDSIGDRFWIHPSWQHSFEACYCVMDDETLAKIPWTALKISFRAAERNVVNQSRGSSLDLCIARLVAVELATLPLLF